jgi:microsomal dipeptidase-like Zn-dependent dipeptidase
MASIPPRIQGLLLVPACLAWGSFACSRAGTTGNTALAVQPVADAADVKVTADPLDAAPAVSPADVATDVAAGSSSREVWRWGPARRDECTSPGLRQMSAPLRNLPDGVDAEKACRHAPRNVVGIDFAAPDRCVQQGQAMRGEWDVPDSACAATPPAPPVRGAMGKLSSDAPLEGFADLHLHQMGHLGFGGSVVWGGAFGPPAEVLGPIPAAMKRGHDLSEALVDGEILGGLTGLVTHGESGYPDFTSWPSRALATHQQAYEDWLFRAYQGGLRLMVMLAVNSEDMFGRGENDLAVIGGITIQPTRAQGRSSNDMEALEWQVREAYRMQDAIDARNGGAGQGWYRIVRDPDEASAAIAKGQMAVILGTELQHLFNCDVDRPACQPDDVVRGLDRLEAMGVNYVFPIHHKLNQFGGPSQFNPLTNGPTFDCFETAEKCSSAGLTPLGRFLIEELTARGMLIDTEHMSWKAFDDALAIAEARQYPVLASHVGAFDLKADEKQTEHLRRTDQLRRLLATGGMLGIIEGVGAEEYARSKTGPVPLPMSCNGADSWANVYLYMRDLAGGGLAGNAGRITMGSDWNGFAAWPAPRYASSPCEPPKAKDGQPIPKPAPVSYPLALPEGLVPAAVGGTTTLPPMGGPRAWDYNKEGLMNVGLTPEFMEDMRLMGLTLADLEPIYRSARGVVELWRTARDREVPGDRHRLRWVPESPFDLMTFSPHDPGRDVAAEPGFPLCRTARSHKLGFLEAGSCHVIEPAEGTPSVTPPGVITSYHAGRCLDVDGQSLADGARVQQWACNGGSNQTWQLRPAADGSFEIVAGGSDKCLEIDGGAVAIGSAAVQRACSGASHQRWRAVRSGNTFSLRPVHSQLCLEVPDQSRANGARVVQTACTGAAHQQWVIEALRAGDHERLYQADKNRIAWLEEEGAALDVPVTVDGTRPICRGHGATSFFLGVVSDGACVGQDHTGMPGESRRFERLYQAR